ncbi:MAG: DUF58 domain-containing protein [Anaerolineae bacterium]|nr:DUF58 domain-containing protein [Gloeobacterales cyanobacterium ES-bin-313]
MTKLKQKTQNRWPRPSFGAVILLGLSLFFFLSATNTLSGWLYVLSAMLLGVLVIGFGLPLLQVSGLRAERPRQESGQAGQALNLSLTLHNPTKRPRQLLIAQDQRPEALGGSVSQVIEVIEVESSFRWQTEIESPRRGVYAWSSLSVRSAAPLGLFWQLRPLEAPTEITIYPRIWPLSRCSWLEQQQDAGEASLGRNRSRAAQEITRSVRPYRFGDARRLIHWRTTARRGELQVRELEQQTTSSRIILALDHRPGIWSAERFELAVEAIASLFMLGQKLEQAVSLWTGTGVIDNRQAVLDYLARIRLEDTAGLPPGDQDLLWFTADRSGLIENPQARYLDFGGYRKGFSRTASIDATLPLGPQLEMLPLVP